MVDISKETCKRNAIETILDNDRTLCLNKNHIEEGLDHKNFARNYINISFKS